MKVRATLRLRNEMLIAAREKLEWSQAKLALAAGVRLEAVGCLERMQFANMRAGEIRKIAAFLAVDEDTLAPPDLRGENVLHDRTIVREVTGLALLGMSSTVLLEDKDAPMQAEDMAKLIDSALDTLTFREREILKLRHGIGAAGQERTLDEVGRIFRITRSRVASIESAALRKLRSPRVARKLACGMGLETET